MSRINTETEFILQTVFHYHEPEDGMPFYWRSCALEPGEYQGTQGYLIVWVHDDGDMRTHHTYHLPTNTHP